MITIHRVPLAPAEPQEWIECHKGAIPLSVLVFDGQIRLYLQVDDQQPVVRHTITVVPAGHAVAPNYGRYVGSYVLPAEYHSLQRRITIVGHVYFTEGEA